MSADDDFPELDHITTVAQAKAIAEALLERCRGAAETIRIETNGA